MANIPEPEAPLRPKASTIVIAILVPAAFLIVFLALILLNRRTGFSLPRLVRTNDALVREARMRVRQEELEKYIKTQYFNDWLAGQNEKHPDSPVTSDPICTICLDEFTEEAQVRGLCCSHAFHSQCLDKWFTQYNEYCPLCHRPIIPGTRAARKRSRENQAPIPVVLIV